MSEDRLKALMDAGYRVEKRLYYDRSLKGQETDCLIYPSGEYWLYDEYARNVLTLEQQIDRAWSYFRPTPPDRKSKHREILSVFSSLSVSVTGAGAAHLFDFGAEIMEMSAAFHKVLSHAPENEIDALIEKLTRLQEGFDARS